MIDARLQALRDLAEPVLTRESAELVELTLRRQGRQLVVCLLVDKVGGVTIQHCARLNKQLGEALEQSGLLEESYTLEVSSPGLDRPLVLRRDYERAIGEQLELHVGDAPQATKPLAGMLLSVQDQGIVLNTASGNTTIPFTQIHSARKRIQFSGRRP